MRPLTFCIVKVVLIVTVQGYLDWDPPTHNNALDLSLYENVLDPEECAKQLTYIIRNDPMLMIQFLDAGIRIPRGVFKGNFRDMGNYHQCLGIKKEVEDMSIEGKYCVVRVPLRQDELEIPSLPTLPEIPQIPWPNITWPQNSTDSKISDNNLIEDLKSFNHLSENMRIFLGNYQKQSSSRLPVDSPLADIQYELAVCLPKVCSAKNAADNITPNSTGTLKLEEAFCRLPNDKPWVAADTVAVVIFSFIGLLVILSTGYDLFHSVLMERDPKQASTLYTSFSVYTNSRKFFTFNSSPNAITCLDGIRSIAMMWVIVGHTFSTQLSFVPANPVDMSNWMMSFTSLWITSGPITVDTFFAISGILLVYTTASKLSRSSLLKNLHLFYLNRVLRMYPVLATAVLIQASFQNRVTDGPYWYVNAHNTNNCRQYWWTTLLYVQNLVNPISMCLPHSWYLAIDMQLYLISPIFLYWVLGGNKRAAWTALAGALMTVFTAQTIYNFLMEFQSSVVSFSRSSADYRHYMTKYYLFTLTRSTPFFVGMIFGYILHLCKGKTIRIPRPLVALLWTIAGATTTTVVISTYFTIQPDWKNQTADSIINSSIRPAWAASIAWLTFACAKGYAGPINWFLSLHIFKILGRLSYAMYILHYPLIYVINGTTLAPIFFSVEYSLQRFMIDFMVAAIAAYLITVLIDLPFTRLIGMALGGEGARKMLDAKKNDDLIKNGNGAPGIDIADLKKLNAENGPDITRN